MWIYDFYNNKNNNKLGSYRLGNRNQDRQQVVSRIGSKQLMKTIKYFIVWIYDNAFVWDKGCDNVVVFPFH